MIPISRIEQAAIDGFIAGLPTGTIFTTADVANGVITGGFVAVRGVVPALSITASYGKYIKNRQSVQECGRQKILDSTGHLTSTAKFKKH
jgi:hypothetical protein